MQKSDFSLQYKVVNWVVFVLFGFFRGSLTIALTLALTGVVPSPGNRHPTPIGLSPAFILVARAPPPILLFALLVFIRCCRSEEVAQNIKENMFNKKTHLKLIYLGFSQGLPFICFSYAVQTVSPSVVTIIMSATPLLTQLSSLLPFPAFDKIRKPLTPLKALGFVLGIGGIILTVMQDLATGNFKGGWTGYPLAIAGVVIWGFGTALWGAIKGKSNDYMLSALGQNFWAGVISAVISYFVEYPTNHWDFQWTTVVLVGVIWVSIGSGFGSALMQHWLYQSKYMGEVKSAGVLYISPIISMIEVNIVYHTFAEMQLWQIACEIGGFLLVVAGLLMVNWKRKKPTVSLTTYEAGGVRPDAEETGEEDTEEQEAAEQEKQKLLYDVPSLYPPISPVSARRYT